MPGWSGIAAADGPLPTFGSGISPRRAISWTHCPGVSAELEGAGRPAPFAAAPPCSGANSTRMLSVWPGEAIVLAAPG